MSEPSFEIPPNNPAHPRWLLDLELWQVRAYKDIKFSQDPESPENGYGIISYTWGLFWDGNDVVAEKDAPKGIDWKIPRLGGNAVTLAEAKRVIGTMKQRYVWWDWMCVPQGGRHREVAGEEIGKQMAIYRNARSSIVWLHNTNWEQKSVLKDFLRTRKPTPLSRQFLQDFDSKMQESEKSEPWLTSIWTLQEGVLLNHSRLVDARGATLPDNPAEKQFHDAEATVIDLAMVPTSIVSRIAQALLSGKADDDDLFNRFVSVPQNRIWVQQILCRIIRSGLFGYYDNPPPLAILAGKETRRYDKKDNKDQYWALLGALDLAVLPNYDWPMPRVREEFFTALLHKYQWKLFLAAALCPNTVSDLSWPQVIADGHIIPLQDLFFRIDFLPGLPRISWSGDSSRANDAILLGAGGAPIEVFKLKKTGYFRRYTQTRKGIYDLVDVTKPDTEAPIRDALYLHLGRLDSKFGLAGKRCIEMRGCGSGEGFYFNGVVDLWVPAEDVVVENTSNIALYLPREEL